MIILCQWPESNLQCSYCFLEKSTEFAIRFNNGNCTNTKRQNNTLHEYCSNWLWGQLIQQIFFCKVTHCSCRFLLAIITFRVTKSWGGAVPTLVSDYSEPRLCLSLLRSYFTRPPCPTLWLLDFPPRDTLTPTVVPKTGSSAHLGVPRLCPRTLILNCLSTGSSSHLSIDRLWCLWPVSWNILQWVERCVYLNNWRLFLVTIFMIVDIPANTSTPVTRTTRRSI